MDYEKAYKEALDAMRIFIYPKLSGDAKIAADHVFPELADSNDERIRKELISMVELALNDGSALCPGGDVTKEDALAWLEKQKEQKPNINREYLEERLRGLIDKEGEYYRGAREELAHLFYILGGQPSQYLINNVAKEEQKPAECSEEDEKMLNDCIMALSNWRDAVANYGHEVAPCQKLIDFLKSLRPQPHWKPSEEQMKALQVVIEHGLAAPDREASLAEAHIESLYQDLKSL